VPNLPTNAELLTPEEKVRVRHHLGFLQVQEVYTFILGQPAAVETQFSIETAMNKLRVEAVPLVRDLLARCDATEGQRFDDQEVLVASKVGSIELRGKDEQDGLVRNYNYWRQALANAFGAWTNPFDRRDDLTGSGINARVEG
jgi:hypothetical protein